MEKKVKKVATKANDAKEDEVEVKLTYDTVTLEILQNTRYCVVL